LNAARCCKLADTGALECIAVDECERKSGRLKRSLLCAVVRSIALGLRSIAVARKDLETMDLSEKSKKKKKKRKKAKLRLEIKEKKKVS
jgi:hypothetical protein